MEKVSPSPCRASLPAYPFLKGAWGALAWPGLASSPPPQSPNHPVFLPDARLPCSNPVCASLFWILSAFLPQQCLLPDHSTQAAKNNSTIGHSSLWRCKFYVTLWHLQQAAVLTWFCLWCLFYQWASFLSNFRLCFVQMIEDILEISCFLNDLLLPDIPNYWGETTIVCAHTCIHTHTHRDTFHLHQAENLRVNEPICFHLNMKAGEVTLTAWVREHRAASWKNTKMHLPPLSW